MVSITEGDRARLLGDSGARQVRPLPAGERAMAEDIRLTPGTRDPRWETRESEHMDIGRLRTSITSDHTPCLRILSTAEGGPPRLA